MAVSASATEPSVHRRPEPSRVPLVVGGLSLGVAAVSGGLLLGSVISHQAGCAAGAALALLTLGRAGGCGENSAAAPLGLIALSALALSGVMFLIQFANSSTPRSSKASLLSDGQSRRAVLPPSLQPSGRTDLGWSFGF